MSGDDLIMYFLSTWSFGFCVGWSLAWFVKTKKERRRDDE